jgi:hypothetical protein
MQKEINSVELDKWTNTFNNNPPMPFGTISALISLPDLESYIQKIKAQQADSIRLYFVRFRSNEVPTENILVNGKLAEGCKWREVADGFTQASIVMVPTKNFMHDENFIFSADDIVVNNVITALLPGTTGQGTALNPPAKPLPPKKDTP